MSPDAHLHPARARCEAVKGGGKGWARQLQCVHRLAAKSMCKGRTAWGRTDFSSSNGCKAGCRWRHLAVQTVPGAQTWWRPRWQLQHRQHQAAEAGRGWPLAVGCSLPAEPGAARR